MFESGELLCSSSLLDGECVLVDACVHSVAAYDLRSVEASVCGGEGYLDSHLGAAGIVACMGAVVYGG